MSKFCWWLLLFLLLLLFQTTFLREWCVLSQKHVIICFNQDRPPGESRPEVFLKLTFSYILGQGGTEFDFKSKSYGKWTIYDDIDELALNNFSNLIRNRPKTLVLVEFRFLQVERIIEGEGSCLSFHRFVAAVISWRLGLYLFPRGPSAWSWGKFFVIP